MMCKSISEKEIFQDATDKLGITLPEHIGNALTIKSDCIDIRMHNSPIIKFKLFLLNKNDSEFVQLEVRKESPFKIIVLSTKKNIKGYIDLSLPCMDSLTIQTKSGDVYLGAISSKNIYIKSNSGDVCLHSIQTKECTVQTETSDIFMELPKNIYKLMLKSTSGDVIKENIKSIPLSPDIIICKSECGDITVVPC